MAQSLNDAPEGGIPNGMTEEVFLKLIQMELEHRKKVADANKARSTFRKSAKARGIMLGPFDRTIDKMDQSRTEVKEAFAIEEQYARWAKLPFGTQSDMFNTDGTRKKAEEEDQDDIAFAKGFQAGVIGASADVPEDYLPQNQKWLEGYNAGQASLAKKIYGDDGDTGSVN